jgi:hypothetical protein
MPTTNWIVCAASEHLIAGARWTVVKGRPPHAVNAQVAYGELKPAFVVYHNPNSGRHDYAADPTDAIASAQALLAQGESTWLAGNCRRMLRVGDLLLFKFGGARLQQEPGIYAAAHVTKAPSENQNGTWVLRYQPDETLTQHLMGTPIVGRHLDRVVSRSFGASIQPVPPRGRATLARMLRDRYRPNPRASDGRSFTHGLLILKEPLDKILAGTKTWEIRGKATARRGPVALIQSKSGCVVGTCELVDVVGPLTLPELQRSAPLTGFRPNRLPYSTTYAWVLPDARRLADPVPYKHPAGAVIWVRLKPSVLRTLG